MSATFAAADVVIRDMPPVPVAILEHRGDPATLGDTIRRFVAWRRARGLTPAVAATYNILHGDPRGGPPEAYRIDLCVATDRAGEGMVAGLIPGGRCAVLRVVGGDLEGGALFLHRDWLPESGAGVRGLPLYCRRVSFPPEVPAEAAVTELYLPLL